MRSGRARKAAHGQSKMKKKVEHLFDTFFYNNLSSKLFKILT